MKRKGYLFPVLFLGLLGLLSCEGSLFYSPDPLLGANQAPLSILSWNVQNLFDEHGGENKYPEFRPDAQVWNRKTLYNKMEKMAGVLDDLPELPAIMIWQEVESPRLAVRFLERFLKATDYHTIIGSSHTRPQVIVFSRVPLDGVEIFSLSTEPSTGRDFIKIDLTWSGEDLSIVGVHLKSWAGQDAPLSRLIRQKELTALGEWLEKDFQAGRTVLIIGDLNTRTRADLWQGAELPAGFLGDSHFFVEDLTHARTDGTYWSQGKIRWLDGALLASSLKEDKEVQIQVINHPLLRGEKGEPLRFSRFQKQGVSDHFPFLVHFISKNGGERT